MEQHRIETRFGPVDVRVYRLREGWWPIVLGGRERLPAEPVVAGRALPTSVGAALRGLQAAIDAMHPEQPASD